MKLVSIFFGCDMVITSYLLYVLQFFLCIAYSIQLNAVAFI